jgi:diguanylate cyclase (GGDEF)-like protein
MDRFISVLRSGRAVTALSTLVIVVGVLVLFGWTFDLELLKRIFPTLVAMNPITAVAFILLGLAVPCSQAPQEDWLPRRTARLCAAAVGLIGTLRLGDAFLGWSVGADQLLFASKLNMDLTGQANRMAPNTALNFLLLGCALLFFNSKRRSGLVVSQACTFLSFVASLLPAVGYAYGTKMLYGIGHFIPMALHTAVCFMAVCISILFARPGRGLTVPLMDESVSGLMMRRLLPTVICLPIAIGWLRLEGQKLLLYDDELGVALMVVAHILLLAAIVWGTSFKILRFDLRQKQAEAQLQELTLTDELTGLRNRRGFLLLTEQEVKLARHGRIDIGFWIVYADLDGLKEINDRFGHAVGSRAIVQAAEILKETFRETDIIARLGGDEFGILAVSNEPEGGRVLVKRLLENLQAFNARAALSYRLSLSAGTVPFDAGITSIEDALQDADFAMYEHKRARKPRGIVAI